MPAVTQPRNGGAGPLTMALAIMLGHGALFPLRAQDLGPFSPDPQLTGDTSTGRPDPGERLRRDKARHCEQRKNTLRAEAAYLDARLAREIAQIAIEDYIECVYPQELAEAEREITLAVLNLAQAQRDLTRARENAYRGFGPEGPAISEELSAKKATFALEQAQSKKKVLIDYTKVKRIKELKTEFDKARSSELAKKVAWDLEKSRESELERRVVPWQVIVAKLGAR